MNRTQSLISAAALLLPFAATANAQGNFRDVQFRAVNFDTGVLEVTNFGPADRPLTGWRFCSHDFDQRRNYTSPTALDGIVLAPGESLFIHFNDDAPAGDPKRLDRSAVGNFALPLDQDAYGIQFFRPDGANGVSFGNSSLIADHVQWTTTGSTPGQSETRTAQAVGQGLWTATGDFVETTDRTFRIALTDTSNGRLHGPSDYATYVAELTVQEVLVDPVGPNSGNQKVEIRNDSGADFTPIGWFFCIPFAYRPLPEITIPDGGVVTVHIGRAGTDRETDFYLPTMRDMNPDDGFFIFRSNSFGNAEDIVDCVLWGNSTARANQAVQVGQWTAVGDNVTLPTIEGETIAYAGRGVGPTYWYRDASATIGEANTPDVRASLGGGCADSNGVTPELDFLTPGADGNRDFAIEIRNGTPFSIAAVQAGLPILPPVDVLGCGIALRGLWFRAALLDGNGNVSVPDPIPTGIAGLGIQVTFQGFVVYVGAPNSLFTATQGVAVTLN